MNGMYKRIYVSMPNNDKNIDDKNMDKNNKDVKQMKTTTTTTTSKFAYVYVVGGCDPDKPAYQNFIQNILINTYLMREEGSTSDVIIYIQMSYKSQATTLPDNDIQLLTNDKFNIHIRYLPKDDNESYDNIIMEKFRILDLIQYERILYLDADVTIRGNMDYILELSLQGTLKRNVIFANKHSPASGSIFIISPLKGDWDHIIDIIREKNERGSNIPFPHWDNEIGWGHQFIDGDYYELTDGTQNDVWDFAGANSDQGLLYHWVKYEEKSFSIIMNDSIQNWDVVSTDDNHAAVAQLVDTLELDTVFGDDNNISIPKYNCFSNGEEEWPCKAPHNSYIHFSVSKKPWLHKPPKNLSEEYATRTPRHFWYHTLSIINNKFNMGIDIEHFHRGPHRPLLGLHPTSLDDAAALEVGESLKNSAQVAYVFVVGGCDPNKPVYRNFLYDIMINTETFKNDGSVADVIVFIQMSYNSESETLPDSDVQMLEGMGINIHYIPKTEGESFDRLMFDKFRILELTQYDRVLYVDSDIMVRGSLDYLFQLSMDGTLKENFIISGRDSPALGSMFMVAPHEGDWDRLLEIIQDKEERSTWDEKIGWGQPFDDDDDYETSDGEKHKRWDFPQAAEDQGLLYHWVKYEKKSVSILVSSVIRNLGKNLKGQVHQQKVVGIKVFEDITKKRDCWKGTLGDERPCVAPYSDFVHFHGQLKPWLTGPPQDFSEITASSSAKHNWFYTLQTLDKKLALGLDFKNWDTDQRPLLGLYASDNDNISGTTYSSYAKAVSPYTHNTTTSAHRFAYAYVIGGCKPEDPSYRNYFNDIMISTYNQREEGSTADVIVFVQMAFESEYDTLPQEDLALLNAMEIQIKYIPKAEDESFYRIMLDKFLILGLTQYDRVLFMDGDVMARGSLDYLFHFSMKGILKKNLVIMGQTEPANGGFFMLAPHEGAQERIMKIIKEKEQRGADLPWPHWDEEVGWGHKFEDDDDYYELMSGKKFHKWEFYGAFADQGLLYHWVKYEEKSVSIVCRRSIQNWDVDEKTGKIHMENEISLDDLKSETIERDCWKGTMKMRACKAPHSDFVHFTGRSKPWLGGPPDDFGNVSEETSPKHYWFHILSILNDKMQIGLDFKNWRSGHKPFLGMFPTHESAAKTSYAATTNTDADTTNTTSTKKE